MITFCLTSTGVGNALGGGGYTPNDPRLRIPLAGLGVYKDDLGLNRRIGPPEEYPPSSRAAEPLFLDPSPGSEYPIAELGAVIRATGRGRPTVRVRAGVRRFSSKPISRLRRPPGGGK